MLTLPGYRLDERLYESATSRVFRGWQHDPGRPVVVKLLYSDYPPPEVLARFRVEYDLLRRIRLPGVVAAYELVKVDNTLAFSMEDVGGASLGHYLQHHALPLGDALRLAVRLTGIVADIHRHRVMHKDLNPSNIIYNPGTDAVKVIDFGIATLLPREYAGIRNPDVLEGTLAYLSPEQTGRMNRSVDYRTDFYSLGATLYEMFTGRRPFLADDPLELVHAHIARMPPPPHTVRPECPEALSPIIMKLLAKTAEERYQSAHGLQVDLEHALKQWEDQGTIAAFPVGEHDASGQFRIPQRLYGRTAETAALLDAFDRVSDGQTEMILVAGAPGIGKSVLVREIHKPIVRRQGYFIAGKFDQLQQSTPYQALIQAFQELVRQLLTERAERIAQWRSRLLAALGPNGRVLTDVIPEVTVIIGEPPPLPPLGPMEAQNRFNLVLRAFVRVFAQAAHPLVIFLDDLQWAGPTSLQLMQLLVSDPECRHLLLLGAYRDAEVAAAHPLRLVIDEIEGAGVPVHEILLTPLRQAHARQLIEDTLHASAEEAAPLAALVLQKTHGNPFFMNQFLTTLHEEGLLHFDAERRRWRWDTDAVAGAGLTDNVVELMTGRLQKLPEPTRRTLQRAACIGNQFQLGTLATVHEQSVAATAADLWAAAEEGLVTPIDDAYRLFQQVPRSHADGPSSTVFEADVQHARYRFLHDRVQQAAYALIPDDERRATHLQIGRLLLGHAGDVDERAEALFEVVHHLNVGRSLIEDQDERDRLARLNLLAGRRAKASTAYRPALTYLTTGVDLLRTDAWRTHYHLALALHTEAAEAAYLSTDFARMEALVQQVLDHAHTLLDKVKAYEIQIQAYIAQQKLLAAIETTRDVLRRLGVGLPRQAGTLHILAGLLRTRATLMGKSIDDLGRLPAMDAPEKLAAMRILMTASAPVYYAMPKMFPLITFHMVQLSVRYGNAPASAFGYSTYAVLLCAAFGDVEAGYRFGTFALRLLDQYSTGELHAKVLDIFNTSVKPWKDPVRTTLPAFLEGYQHGLEAGDLEYASLNAITHGLYSFYSGRTLPVVAQEMAAYIDVTRRLKQQRHQHAIGAARQAVLNLMGTGTETTRLVGESYDEAAALPELTDASDRSTTAMAFICKTMLCCLFDEDAEALQHAEAAEQDVEALLGTLFVTVHTFYHALALLGRYPDLPPPRQKQAMKKVGALQKKLKAWAEHAPANYRHKVDLVAAERARVLGRFAPAAAAYDRAIAGARTHAYTHEEALAGEKAARFYLAQDRKKIAQAYLNDAVHVYQQWGAQAKVDALRQAYPDLLALPTGGGTASIGLPGQPVGQLDLASVIKASQAISGEIVLDRLLQTMMRIVIENGGAQKGTLILEEQGVLLIEAEGTVHGEAVVLQSVPVEESPALSLAVVNYVARTHEAVVLADAAREGLFTEDAYIVRHQPRSILCAPLLSQGQLMGLLYLENNATTGAFTPDRLEVLRLLSAEIAISIENARLYNNLEQKVAQRTEALRQNNLKLEAALADLKATQAQLIHAEKLASLGQLTAGIAHEIKNPLNFVNNFAELNVELAEELIDELRGDPARRLADVQDVLDDLKLNAQKIQEQGRRADGIIKSMMDHARTRPGKQEPTNVNALLEEYLNLAYYGLQAQEHSLAVALDRHYDAAAPVVSVIPQEMGRVFINLLNNAFYAVQDKARTAGDGYVPTVSVQTHQHDGRLEIRISDNGGGIPAAMQARIFEPFFTTKPAGDGTGLGLSLSYDIVTQGHNGQLDVETIEGEGTTFVITLSTT